MANPPGQFNLQVMTATVCLNRPLDLQRGPLLITCITSAAIAHQLLTHLQSNFPADHPISLVSEAEQAESLNLSLQELREQLASPPGEGGPFPLPWSLYLPCPTLTAVQQLIDVVAQLRSPVGGCPWDLAQTPESLTPYVIEEAYEVVHAIREGEPAAIAEELGDLLLQVVLQAQIASEYAHFSLRDVAQSISAKLIRRHPHVFADLPVENVEDVRRQWEEIKAAERGEAPDTPPPLSQTLRRYARTLPPLQAGLKIAEKAGTAGLDWTDISGVWDKFYEEFHEFQEALLQNDPVQQQAELGDLIFTLINLARWCQLNPITALEETYQRFIRRLEKIEAMIDRPLSSYTLEELEHLWQQAKATLKAEEVNPVCNSSDQEEPDPLPEPEP